MEKVMKDIKEDIFSLIKQKKYLFIVCMVFVFAYGYYFTYESVYIDDMAMGRYYTDGRVLRQGRWGMWLLAKIINQTEYRPFINKLGGGLCLLFSCMLICCLFQKVCQRKINLVALIAFSSCMVSYSLINELLFYVASQWIGGIIYIFSIAAVWYLKGGGGDKKELYNGNILTNVGNFIYRNCRFGLYNNSCVCHAFRGVLFISDVRETKNSIFIHFRRAYALWSFKCCHFL